MSKDELDRKAGWEPCEKRHRDTAERCETSQRHIAESNERIQRGKDRKKKLPDDPVEAARQIQATSQEPCEDAQR